MKLYIICETDGDYHDLLNHGYPRESVFRDPEHIDADERTRKQSEAVIVTDSNQEAAVDYAEMTASFLRDEFLRVRVLALPGGYRGYARRI